MPDCLQSCGLWPSSSPPGSSVHRILQARILDWVAISSSRGSSWPGDGICVLTSPALAGGFFTTSSTWEWWWTSFHIPACHLYTLFREMFSDFCSFSVLFSNYFCCSFSKVLYIFSIQAFCQIKWLASIFSQGAACLFIRIGSFTEQTLLTSMRSDWSVFPLKDCAF